MTQDTTRQAESTLAVTLTLERFTNCNAYYLYLNNRIIETVWHDMPTGRYRITNPRGVNFWGDTPEQAVSAWVDGQHEHQVDTTTIDHDAFWSVCQAHTVSADTYRPVYTLGSPDMLIKMDQAMRATGESYPLNLNADDMTALVFALATAIGYVSWDDAGEVQERATSLFSGIAETLGIEGI